MPQIRILTGEIEPRPTLRLDMPGADCFVTCEGCWIAVIAVPVA